MISMSSKISRSGCAVVGDRDEDPKFGIEAHDTWDFPKSFRLARQSG